MNKIYALKYSAGQGGYVPVSELTTHIKKSSRTGTSRKIISSLITTALLSYSSSLLASVVSNVVPYQTYRDFAENKGQFTPGMADIPIYDKTGNVAGWLNKAPMPDFSSADHSSAVATLVSPQYIVSVKHNGGYQNVSFGNSQNTYRIVDRNNHSSLDFHAPRLNKLVTEVAPATITTAGASRGTYSNEQRFPVFYHVGSGTQGIKGRDGKVITLSGAYDYLMGGTVGRPLISDQSIVNNPGNVFDPVNGPMANYGTPGDSGSPLFAWDTISNKWVLVAVTGAYAGMEGSTNWFVVVPEGFVQQTMQDDVDAPVITTTRTVPVDWRFNRKEGTGTLTQGNKTFAMHGLQGTNLNAGKNITFSGVGGQIILHDSLNQGAGALTFTENYTVTPYTNQTWVGAGLDIARNAEVTWQVNGEKNDNLHKIGEGTLKVNGIGINEGGLKVGDGTVILAQRPDNQGKTQAFSSVNIASGRPTVVLGDEKQVNPDTITWGFRGGKLDVNGNNPIFHKLNAADYGAVITNQAPARANITLNYQTPPEDIALREWSYSNKGTPGDLYEYRNPYSHTTDYFILRTSSYSWYPSNQTSSSQWEYIGHNKDDAVNTVVTRKNAAGYLYHGQFTGNLNVINTVAEGTQGALVLDGATEITGNFTQQNGRLIFQGHPVIHAYNSATLADKLKAAGDDSVKTQPVSFDQPDWENRTFRLNTLLLRHADFGLARNATLFGDIDARQSTVTLGSPSLYIDKNDGSGKAVAPIEGLSTASEDADMSRYQGNITLADHSVLSVREKFSGTVTAQDSRIAISSTQATLDGYSQFSRSSLELEQGAALTATGGWESDSDVIVGLNAALNLTGTPLGNDPTQVTPAFYTMNGTNGFSLREGGALHIAPFAFVSGNIRSDSASTISIGDVENVRLADNLSFNDRLASSLFNGFRNVYGGTVLAPRSVMNMTETLWQMPGDSRLNTVSMTRSLTGFTGSKTGFSTLTVDTLQANNSGFSLRTDLRNSDKIVVTQKAEGANNTLFVNFLKKPESQDKLSIPLVSAPVGTDPSLFKAAKRVVGFSQVTPTLHTTVQDGKMQWVLDGYNSVPDKGTALSANSFMGMGYKNFMTEVNNLNKRMGDLRDTQGADGMWVRIMNGAGTGDAGYSDRYTHLQTGYDKKHRMVGADLFTGILMSYTNSSASGRAYQGDTHSLGGGLYASLMFDSGAYMDVIGKYIHHDNDYTAGFAGLGKRNYNTHSWYAGIEGGYRYPLTESLYVEPQAELVYGAVSGTTLKWSDNGMDVSMRNKDFNPLIGRTGVALGKTFSGKGWSLTARTGLDWQFDLVSNGETALRDASGEKRFTGEKDSRMLYHVGLNAQVKNNMRFGLELEQSAFGKYNIDHAINANFRYMF
ncbi:autotransporter outer membrane beta-barrel domain-containing protein [Salmonella enterica subsp. salamae]|nr:autotransporter outer membrane beta-barrel domain-containing protein [Salmonella enterica subsp. salamae]ECJ2282518.1 autotransporter outer membrane beta-barrel domain-containing protein [Salmonella enterica subsp. salamae]HCC0887057.1 autotransporter outer membrane beta-barrel domain-containing protein [Salmonella enterica]